MVQAERLLQEQQENLEAGTTADAYTKLEDGNRMPVDAHAKLDEAGRLL